jgi:hypothetical protein
VSIHIARTRAALRKFPHLESPGVRHQGVR